VRRQIEFRSLIGIRSGFSFVVAFSAANRLPLRRENALAFFDLGRISDGKLRHIEYCLLLWGRFLSSRRETA
jgi:hypothetical protein